MPLCNWLVSASPSFIGLHAFYICKISFLNGLCFHLKWQVSVFLLFFCANFVNVGLLAWISLNFLTGKYTALNSKIFVPLFRTLYPGLTLYLKVPSRYHTSCSQIEAKCVRLWISCLQECSDLYQIGSSDFILWLVHVCQIGLLKITSQV